MMRLWRKAFEPVDIASAVAFRVAFGVLMVIAVARYVAYGWIDQLFVAPRVFFPYPGFEWIVPLPAWAIYGLFGALGAAAVGIALGLWYRASALLFCLGFTYAHLIDRSNYLNHYYLVSLVAALLVILPLHRAGSLDARRRLGLRAATLPAWMVWLLRFQLAVVYVFGAVAKFNTDWLLHAQPLRIWLGADVDLPLVGAWLEQPWIAYVCSYAGLLFDASVVPLLMWRRSRPLAYAAVLVFHVLTALLFPIGMFPWLMIALTPIFFAPEWPRQLVGGVHHGSERVPDVAPTPRRLVGAAVLAGYAALQIALPLRHLTAPGDLYWDEHDFRFAWQIMVMEKFGRASFVVTDPASGAAWQVAPADELTALQARMMATQPDLILSYAHHLAAAYGAASGHPVEVRADVFVALNGRPSARFVDPSVDLAALPDDAPRTSWVLPHPDRGVGAIALAGTRHEKEER